MSHIASKNLYDLLGNDPELDPDRAPEPPSKVIDKPAQRTGKRNAGAEAPAAGAARPAAGGRGGRADQAGALNNRSEKRDDGVRQDRHSNRTREPRGGAERGGRGRGRGAESGRGYSGRYQRTNRDDRQSHSGIGDQQKQAAHGWGDEKDGSSEWKDEQAGEAIARAESRDEPGFTPDAVAGDPAFSNGPGGAGDVIDEEAVAEEEDKTKSYDQYLAEQAEKRLALGGDSLKVRKANEGSKQKFPEGTAVSRNPDEENFFAGSGGKARREKINQPKKEQLALDGQYYAAPDAGDRGGRGRGRGGRGRGEGRGGGDRGGRGGRGRGGGEFRGDRAPRGDRGGRGGFNASDSSAFPALGS